jgi:hypothetical protein
MTALSFLLRLLILAGVVFVLWWAFRPRPDFTISVRNREVRIRGRFPKAHRGKLEQLLREEMTLRGRVTITGRRHPNGYLALGFRGPVAQTERQRIRNLLVNVL